MTSGFVLALELIGTFAFALSGATLGVRRQRDLFGVLVLAFAAAMLVAEVPSILRRGELYAVAAALGASVVVAGDALDLPSTPLAVGGAAACFASRYFSIHRRWMLPVANTGSERSPD